MAFKAEPSRAKANYYGIKEGSFRLPSTIDDPAAVKREGTNPKTGQSFVAYERSFYYLSSMIKDVRFVDNTTDDGTVLRSLHIVLEDDLEGKGQIISVPQDSRWATDFLKCLPNIDITKEVMLRPYDYIGKKDGKRKAGLGVQQANVQGEFIERVEDYFTEVTVVEGKNVFAEKHGFPAPSEEDRDDWKFYFQKVSKFLVKYTKENVQTKFRTAGAWQAPRAEGTEVTADDANKALDSVLDEALSGGRAKADIEDINPDDIPF